MIFTEREIEYLDGQRIGRLATLHPNGTLQVSPVGFRYNRELGTIDIGGRDMAASRKFRNVLANGKVAFVVDDVPSVDPWQVRCLEIRGRGEALAEPTDSNAPLAGPIIRVHPQRIISFGVDPGNPAAGKRDVPEA
ncbi:PPOX class F420-dependent oxidoreductase [Microbispora sp. GKU 823]|uniref:PPOX class F420-dependent oxidoreductase n=1 Tax=Microbispora sp. GKU 823 TaxID=1652100 RepID=UPI0009A2F270|nr:PPOX class F420-dependent oxidoreductase [Microbispora sp. GKU 823]